MPKKEAKCSKAWVCAPFFPFNTAYQHLYPQLSWITLQNPLQANSWDDFLTKSAELRSWESRTSKAQETSPHQPY